ncbi:MAG: hypothetical protein K2W82_13040 [Candidatus Obscuribacterales bacterium]|nr:hypothetical protein [Candidatus Obscuribacterales bacterium]
MALPATNLTALAKQIDAGQINEELANTLNKYIEAHPQESEAYFLLAELYQNAGFQDLSGELLDRFEKRAPGIFLAAYHKSVYYDDTEFADKYLLYAQKRYPLDPAVLMMNANGLRLHNRFAEARSTLAPIINQGATIPRLCRLLADICLQEGNYSQALFYAEEELKRNPSDLAAQEVRLAAKNALGFKLDQELSAISKLYNDRKTRSDAGILLAEHLSKNSRYNEALEPALFGLWCFSSPKMNKRNLDTLNTLVKKIPPDRFELAVNTFVLSNKIDPMLAALVDLKIGQILKANGENKRAIAHFERSLNVTPFFRNKIYLDLAPLYEQMNDYATAARLYQFAFEADPTNPEIRRQYSAFQWGWRRYKQRAKKPDPALRLKKWLHNEQIQDR